MKILVKRKDGVELPVRAHNNSDENLGFDVKALSGPKVVGKLLPAPMDIWGYTAIDYIQYETGLEIAPQASLLDLTTHVLVFPRSSLSKYNLLLANSVAIIDNGFRSNIVLRFKYIFQPEDMRYEQGRFYGVVNSEKVYQLGDKIAQLVPFNNLEDPEFEYVDILPESVRGLDGLGSTGR